MEFTQPLGVGLGLVVRINNQYSHPVCMGRCTDAYTTIKIHGKYHRKTSYLLGNIDEGIGEFTGTGYCVDNMQMMQTIKSQLMMSHGSCTKRSHKSIAQTNCTNKSPKMIMEDKMTSHPRMEMMNDTFGCSRATQVHMEDLRLVNLTEKRPSRRGEQFKAPC